MKAILPCFILLVAITACKSYLSKSDSPATSETSTYLKQDHSTEPEHIQVQHILIGYDGSLPGKKVARSMEEAKTLAEQLFTKAKESGSDFEALVKENSDDQAPGIYAMANLGVAPVNDEFPREQMVPAFGDVGFQLKVGDVGLAPYDKNKSPYGFHIIKRLK